MYENDEWNRILELMKYYKYDNVSQFAKRIGVKRSENLYQIKKGNNQISRRLCEAIKEQFPEVNRSWLLFGEGTMFGNSSKLAPFRYSTFSDTELKNIPFYNNIEHACPLVDIPDTVIHVSRFLIGKDIEIAARYNGRKKGNIKKGDTVFMRYYNKEDSGKTGAFCLIKTLAKSFYGEIYTDVNNPDIIKIPMGKEVVRLNLNDENLEIYYISAVIAQM